MVAASERSGISQRSDLQPGGSGGGAPAAEQHQHGGGVRNPIAQLAGLFGGGNNDGLKEEPDDPFVLYGTTCKRFFIDKLDGEKVDILMDMCMDPN